MNHKPGAHLHGERRIAVRARAAELYLAGCTIRSVAGQVGRSYGATRKLLLEANVQLRERGGRIPKAAA